MTKPVVLDRIVSIISWLIVVSLVWSIVGLWITPPLGEGPFAQLFGVVGAQIFYTVVYGVEACRLTWAKISGRMALRKAMLMVIFLTGVFTFGLTITIIGFSFEMLDNMVMFAFSGVCYLYWKIKTEYMTPEEVEDYFKH